MTNHQATLTIFQQAVFMLAQWANIDFNHSYPNDSDVIKKAKNILECDDNATFKALRLLFDRVTLDKGQSKTHYVPAKAIADEYPLIPYPISEKPSLEELKDQIKKDLTNIKLDQNWDNLPLLTIIVEKYGSHIRLSNGEENNDIAFYDLVRSVAAVAEALSKNSKQENLTLIAGDLSGIQDFIYTISSEGALKSLRARSFYLGLVAEEIVCQILEKLNLPRTNIIYAGGGNLYILAPANEKTYKIVQAIQNKFNNWLWETYKNKLFLALTCIDLPVEVLKNVGINDHSLSNYWQKCPQELAKQKNQKFSDQLSDVLTVDKKSYSQPCKICHRDDIEEKNLKSLKLNHTAEDNENETILVCDNCHKLYELGDKLFYTSVVVRSKNSNLFSENIFQLCINNNYYYLLDKEQIKPLAQEETIFLINCWDLNEYLRHNRTYPLILGNYGKRNEEKKRFIRAFEMANEATGIDRIGYLRMDVDNLGQIFAKGLGDFYNLPRLASLSRQLSYFFTIYLTSLAKERNENFLKFFSKDQCLTYGKIDKCVNQIIYTSCFLKLLQDKSFSFWWCVINLVNSLNLLFIYAGGDDLFISGSWNEVVEFAFDIYQAFRAYTGYNPDITLSGGIYLADIKFPLYQAASQSGEAEHKAKENGRDSLGLFGQVFKWDEWLGNSSIIDKFDDEIKQYLKDEPIIEPFGVLPIVQLLNSIGYSRSFIRNLLIVADIQDQKLKEIEDQQKSEPYNNYKKDIRYYLHLPKIAYTLARLPQSIKREDYNKLSQSLKSPRNAPYFRAIATWIELLNRKSSHDHKNDNND